MTSNVLPILNHTINNVHYIFTNVYLCNTNLLEVLVNTSEPNFMHCKHWYSNSNFWKRLINFRYSKVTFNYSGSHLMWSLITLSISLCDQLCKGHLQFLKLDRFVVDSDIVIIWIMWSASLSPKVIMLIKQLPLYESIHWFAKMTLLSLMYFLRKKVLCLSYLIWRRTLTFPFQT